MCQNIYINIILFDQDTFVVIIQNVSYFPNIHIFLLGIYMSAHENTLEKRKLLHWVLQKCDQGNYTIQINWMPEGKVSECVSQLVSQ